MFAATVMGLIARSTGWMIPVKPMAITIKPEPMMPPWTSRMVCCTRGTNRHMQQPHQPSKECSKESQVLCKVCDCHLMVCAM